MGQCLSVSEDSRALNGHTLPSGKRNAVPGRARGSDGIQAGQAFTTGNLDNTLQQPAVLSKSHEQQQHTIFINGALGDDDGAAAKQSAAQVDMLLGHDAGEPSSWTLGILYPDIGPLTLEQSAFSNDAGPPFPSSRSPSSSREQPPTRTSSTGTVSPSARSFSRLAITTSATGMTHSPNIWSSRVSNQQRISPTKSSQHSLIGTLNWRHSPSSVTGSNGDYCSHPSSSSSQQDLQDANLWVALQSGIFHLQAPSMPRSRPCPGQAQIDQHNSKSTEAGQNGLVVLWKAVESLQVLQDVAASLSALHDSGVVHGDLRASQVIISRNLSLINSRGSNIPQEFTASLAPPSGSGFSAASLATCPLAAKHPSVAYCAPELLSAAIHATGERHTRSSDVYAFGCLMWEVLTARTLHGDLTQEQIVDQVLDGQAGAPWPDSTPAGYANLAARCWAQKASTRPSAASIVAELGVLSSQMCQGHHHVFVELPASSMFCAQRQRAARRASLPVNFFASSLPTLLEEESGDTKQPVTAARGRCRRGSLNMYNLQDQLGHDFEQLSARCSLGLTPSIALRRQLSTEHDTGVHGPTLTARLQDLAEQRQPTPVLHREAPRAPASVQGKHLTKRISLPLEELDSLAPDLDGTKHRNVSQQQAHQDSDGTGCQTSGGGRVSGSKSFTSGHNAASRFCGHVVSQHTVQEKPTDEEPATANKAGCSWHVTASDHISDSSVKQAHQMEQAAPRPRRVHRAATERSLHQRALLSAQHQQLVSSASQFGWPGM